MAFLTKHFGLLQCFPHGFFYDFLKLSLSIFFNIELVENYNYNKFKSCGESTIAFLTKHCELLYVFPHDFFLMNFSKLVFIDFISLILSWLKITITRLNYVGKHCNFPHKTLWIATVFPTWFFLFFLCFCFVMIF